MALVVFNGAHSTVAEQVALHSRLPVSHEYGDRKAILPGGATLTGRKEHDGWVPPDLRIRCRKRCTLMPVVATHTGTGMNRAALREPAQILTCFLSTPDWHASGLDAEAFFLRNIQSVPPTLLPRVGSYCFDVGAFVSSFYEDLAMALASMRLMAGGARLHLKIVPVGVGSSIRTRYGEPLGPLLVPAYLLAMQYVLATVLDETWVETLEFVDHSHGMLTPYVKLRGIRIISGSTRDAFDFAGCSAVPAILAPADAFCRVGGSPSDKNLAATLANNSNIRDIMASAGVVQYLQWPGAARPSEGQPSEPESVAQSAAPTAAQTGLVSVESAEEWSSI